MTRMTKEHREKIWKMIGASIKELRKAEKESQREFGERFGISAASMSIIESGKRGGITLEHIITIAQGTHLQSPEIVMGWPKICEFLCSMPVTAPVEQPTFTVSDDGGRQDEREQQEEPVSAPSDSDAVPGDNPADDGGVCVPQAQ